MRYLREGMLECHADVKNFDFDLSQQFATVEFYRYSEDGNVEATVIIGGVNKHLPYVNPAFNPSLRRDASCVYVKQEDGEDVCKICVVQHKGNTSVQVLPVTKQEMISLFTSPFVNTSYEKS